MMFRSSWRSMQPFPSTSYSLKYQRSLCSIFPRITRLRAATYSMKSMYPSCSNKKFSHHAQTQFLRLPRMNKCSISKLSQNRGLSAGTHQSISVIKSSSVITAAFCRLRGTLNIDSAQDIQDEREKCCCEERAATFKGALLLCFSKCLL